MKEKAQVGYEAYAEYTGGKTFDGRDMPTWDALPDRIQGAWRAAIDATQPVIPAPVSTQRLPRSH